MAKAQQNDGGGLLDSLKNIDLPIFEGVPDKDKQRALLTTALELMRPQDPLKGGGDGQIVEALSRAAGAGLGELDTRQDRGIQQGAQDVTNRVGESTIQLNRDRGESRVRTSKANESNAAVNVTQEARAASEFNENQALREATADLRVAEAEWLRRRHDGTPAGNKSAELELRQINDTAQSLINDNPARYQKADGSINQVLARVDAYQKLNLKELLKNPALAVIIGNEGEASAIRDRVDSLQPEFQGEDTRTLGAVITVTDQADLDAKKADGTIAPGDTVIYNGTSFIVE